MSECYWSVCGEGPKQTHTFGARSEVFCVEGIVGEYSCFYYTHLPSIPGNYYLLLSASMNLTVLDTLYKWNHAVLLL